MEGFISFLTDAVLLSCLVMFVEQVKKFQKPATIEKWKANNTYVILFVLLCLPLAAITSMKDGVFDAGINSLLVMIGITFRTFFIMATVGTFFYDALLKKLLKEKAGIDE